MRGVKSAVALAFAAALWSVSCGSPASPAAPSLPPAPTPPPPSPLVVVVSIDGLRPDALSIERTPNILEMASRGAASWLAQTIYPPHTLPSHASMLTGYPPNVHGLNFNNFTPEKGVSRVPTVFSYARAAGLRTAMVVGKDKFNHLKIEGSLDSYEIGMGDDDNVNRAIVQIQAGADLLMVHLPDVDLCGHANQWMSPKYLQQVNEADQAVGRLRRALPPSGTMIVTADHGGLGPTHGVDRASDMSIPWVIAGPEIRENVIVSRRVSTMDTAATALDVLGLRLAADAVGKPVVEAFVPGSAAARTAARNYPELAALIGR
ncbi:MAG: alkaline phosphatase family protein [Vicinamibacteria bacterium]